MKTWTSLAFRHPVALLVTGMGLLWVSSLLFAPWWLSGAGALLILVVVSTLLPFLKRHNRGGNRVESGPLELVGDDLNALLPRWSGMAHKTRDNLHDVQSQIHGVMQQTEQAVLNIGDCFRNITKKTDTQIKHALSLIQTAHGIEEEAAGASSDVARYVSDTTSLSAIADKIAKFAEACIEAAARPTDVKATLNLVDDVMRRSDLLARRVLASVTADKGLTPNAMMDKVSTLSCEADEISRLNDLVRAHLQNLQKSLTMAYDGLRDLAEEAIADAAVIKSDAAQLAGEATKKNREAAEIMTRINTLGEEVRQDIYKIIVDLQFQDITHQQLQRVKTPVLDELGHGLRAIADETHVLYEKLRRRFIPNVMRIKRTSTANGVSPAPTAGAPDARHPTQAKTENKVELF